MSEFINRDIDHAAQLKAPEAGKSLEQKSQIELEETRELADLGLSLEDLRGKLTLDIGAGAAEVAAAAKDQGIQVVSVDANPEMWTESDEKLPNVNYVKADARQLPFASESFDLAISHAGPLTIADKKETIINSIQEAERILEAGGELRFGPRGLNAAIFEEDELFAPEESANFNQQQRVERIAHKSLEFLRMIAPNISLESVTNRDGKPTGQTYYLLKKTVAET